jgi:hypothetical protein
VFWGTFLALGPTRTPAFENGVLLVFARTSRIDGTRKFGDEIAHIAVRQGCLPDECGRFADHRLASQPIGVVKLSVARRKACEHERTSRVEPSECGFERRALEREHGQSPTVKPAKVASLAQRHELFFKRANSSVDVWLEWLSAIERVEDAIHKSLCGCDIRCGAGLENRAEHGDHVPRSVVVRVVLPNFVRGDLAHESFGRLDRFPHDERANLVESEQFMRSQPPVS